MKRKFYHLISLLALAFGLVLNFIIIRSTVISCNRAAFISCFNFDIILPILLITFFLPLNSIIFSVFIRDKPEDFKNKFYISNIILSTLSLLFGLFVVWLYYILTHSP